MDGVVDWDKFTAENKESKYVSWEEGETKKLVLANWREDKTNFVGEDPKAAVAFDVLSENGKECVPPKKLTMANRSFLRPVSELCKAAFAGGRSSVSVAVKRSGSGKGTRYIVIEAASP